MNKQRRAEIDRIRCELGRLLSEVETIHTQEEDYYDNMPESFQNGEKGEKVQACVDSLQEAIDGIAAADEALNQAVGD
jgi:hypothetical protein